MLPGTAFGAYQMGVRAAHMHQILAGIAGIPRYSPFSKIDFIKVAMCGFFLVGKRLLIKSTFI